MANKIRTILSKSNLVETDIAIVLDVIDDQAEMVQLFDSTNEVIIFAHLNNVPPLNIGDQVLVVHTSQGYVVTGRLRTEFESALDGLSVENGMLTLTAGKSIKIQSGDAVIELTAKGKIKIDGKNIYSISEGRHRLQGSTIELN